MAKIPVPKIHRSMLVQDDAAIYTISLPTFRRHNDFSALLPTNPTATDHGCKGAYGAASPYLKGHTPNNQAKTQYSRVGFALPPEYVDGGAIILRASARRFDTPVNTYTLRFAVRKTDRESGIGANICPTAAVSPAEAWGDHDFTITPTGLVSGDLLDIRCETVLDDTGGVQTSEIWIGDVQMRLDIKG